MTFLQCMPRWMAGNGRGSLDDPLTELSNPLDRWIVSRLHQTQQHITRHMDDYNIPEAVSEVLPFLDDASNWYVRRSRRERFLEKRR